MSDTTDNCVTLNQTVFVVKEKDTTVWEPTLGGNGGFSVSVLQTLNSPRQVVILSATLDGIAIDIEDTATSGSLVVVEKELEVAANIEQLVTMGLVIEQGTFVLQAVEEVNGNERLLASVTQQAGDVTTDGGGMHTQSFQLRILPSTGNIKLRLSSIPLTMGNRSKATGKWITKKIKYLEQENIVVTLCDSTADRYRFGFNGQEKVNEIAGIGNHNTAEFWEYDTRLGRRWNLDPKPNPSISDYATFANNPILYIDILGDTVMTSYRLNDQKGKRTAIYKDDQWIDKKTRKIININEVDGDKTKELMQGYIDLNKIDGLNHLTKAMNTNKKFVELYSGHPKFDYKEYKESGKIRVGVSIIHDHKDIYEGRDNRSNLVSTMAHELGHVLDLFENGTTNLDQFPKGDPDNSVNATYTELYGMFYENIARNHYGFGLRLKYTTQSDKFQSKIYNLKDSRIIILQIGKQKEYKLK